MLRTRRGQVMTPVFRRRYVVKQLTQDIETDMFRDDFKVELEDAPARTR